MRRRDAPSTTAAWATALVVVLALVSVSAFADDSIGVVKVCKGPVTIERGGVQLSASKGTELHRGDRLITGREGYAYVAMRGTAPLAIGPETQVSLDRFAPDDSRVMSRSAPRLLQGLASYFALNRQR